MATIADERFSSLKVLLIDDMAAMRTTLRQQLLQIDVSSVDQASSADEALRLLKKGKYDLILCDYYLGKNTDGQQFLELIKDNGLLPASTIFFMVTAESSYSFVSTAGECLPDDYLIKPFTATNLRGRLERLFERKSALAAVNARLAARDLAGVIVECDKLIDERSKLSVDALRVKGQALLDLGRYDDAKTVYGRILDMRSDLPWAQLGVARALKGLGSLSEAKEHATTLIAENPQFVAAYDLLVSILEEQGNDTEALDTIKRSEEVVPSVRRARMVGEACYRNGDLAAAEAAFSKVVEKTKNSLISIDRDHSALAQVFVDRNEPAKAMKVLSDAKGSFGSNRGFEATAAAIEAQVCVRSGDPKAAEAALQKARDLARNAPGEKTSLALSKAFFMAGHGDEAEALLSQAVRADHEDKRLLALARKVLVDTGNESLTEKIVDKQADEVMAITNNALALARKTQFTEAIALMEPVLKFAPHNTGLLLAAAQVHLLWLAQEGLNTEYVARVREYLGKLDKLIPGNERVAKMQGFFRDTLARARKG
jgi:tetratricopeptide (TPR) repeat protein